MHTVRLEVRHLTRYDYSEPVLLEPQVLRLRPQNNANQRVLAFDFSVEPQPAGHSVLVDLNDTDVISVWFNGPADSLAISIESTIETLRSNPFDYLWQGAKLLPMTYSAALDDVLDPYRSQAGVSAPVRSLARRVAKLAGGQAQGFLPVLASHIRQNLTLAIRPDGPPRAPEETLACGWGSCRDLAVLFIAAARSQGFATRFVSGYVLAPESDEDELHAWAEVYVPGGGWRGFDPSAGLAVADSHVVVASALRPEQAAPISGSYRGTGWSSLETHVQVRELAAVTNPGR